MSRLLLIRPERSVKREFLASMMPTNLAILAAYVRKQGHEVRIWDFQMDPYDEEQFVAGLKEYQPDVVGFTCYTPNIKLGHLLAEVVKRVNPEVVSVVGGPHATYMTKESLQEFWAFDITVVGEGEIPLARICDLGRKALTSDVELPSCGVRRNGEVMLNREREIVENLDEIGVPAYDLLDFRHSKRSMRGFSSEFMPVAELLTSRGCPFTCTFCAAFVSTGRKLRDRSPDSVLHEVKFMMDNFGIKHFNIIDDTFTIRKEHVYPIAEGIHKFGATWNCWAHINTLDMPLLTHMKENGCTGLLIGVESGSPRILKKLKKGLTVERIKKGFEMINAVGFKNVEANFIVGSDADETLEDVQMTKQLIRDINPSILAVSVICPYPGTPVFDEFREKNLIFSYDWNNYVCYGKVPLWRTLHFTPEELVQHQANIMSSFYFNPQYVMRRLAAVSSFSELMYYVKGGFAFLKDLTRMKLSGARKWSIDRGVPVVPDTQQPDRILEAGKLENGEYDSKMLVREMGRSRRVVNTSSPQDHQQIEANL